MSDNELLINKLRFGSPSDVVFYASSTAKCFEDLIAENKKMRDALNCFTSADRIQELEKENAKLRTTVEDLNKELSYRVAHCLLF